MSRIDPKSTLYGQPSMVVRRVLQDFCVGPGPSWGWAARHVADERDRKELVDQLVANGLLEPCDGGRPDHLGCTDAGRRLASASARPLRRSTANKMLMDVLARVRAINADASYCYRVSRLLIFGSFLDPSVDPLGDLDVGYALERKYEYDGPEWRRSQARAPASAWSWSWRVETWPETEVQRHLKARTRGLSLHSIMSDKRAIFSGRHVFLIGSKGPEDNIG